MKTMSMSPSLTVLLLSLLSLPAAVSGTETATKTPPAFLLQDPSDSNCLRGEDFGRCSIDTLWYVVGSPGSYQIHKRPIDPTAASEEDDGLCLSKKICETKPQDATVLSCSHCGSKNWNILGDSDTGYVLTEGGDEEDTDDSSKLCLTRDGNRASMAPCDAEDVAYTPLQLQFASESDIKAMGSPAARLMGAASDGDIALIEELLAEGTDVNVRDWDELTALIPAASAGKLDIVKLLVGKGADVNAADKDGITALMEASIMGHKDVVSFLLESGADVEAAAKSGVTALWLAAGEGKIDNIKLLLEKGAESTNTRSDGITALMTASVGGHAEAVKVLVESGADPTATDKDGLTPLMNAAEKGSVPCLEALLQGADADYVNAFSNTGFSALIIASAHGHKDAAEFLLQAGADIDAIHEVNQVTALMYAAASGHLEVLKLLLEKGANKEFLHSNGGTALLEAATGGEAEAMKVLLEAGAKYDSVDLDGVTPLMAVASQGNLEGQKIVLEYLQKTMNQKDLTKHINMASYSGGTSVMFAAAGGHTECAKDLIDLGANVKEVAKATPAYLEKLKKMIEEGTVNNQDDPHVDGMTALHVAAQGGHLDMVKLLLENKVKVDIKDDESRTPLKLAIKGNFGEVASELVRAGADPNTNFVDADGDTHNLLWDAIVVENTDFATLLIEKGADLYHKDSRQVTTILQASHRGLTDVVEKILEKHGKKKGFVDEASDEGITPLIAACSEGHDKVVELLVKNKNIDVNCKDKDGTNSLMAASARGHKGIVELLLKAGAAVNEQNSDGHTALMFAYNGKNQVETLWERYSQYVTPEEKEKETDGGTGPIIREALDNHTALVDMLLKSGADASLKDKEGHTAKDFDFNPEVDGDVLKREAKAEKVRDESKNEL